MKITVYCGSNLGINERYEHLIWQLGEWIGQNNHQLVYGGGRTGLMGTIATAASQSGSQVIGIIPLVLVEAEVANYDIHHLEVVDTMNQRKEKLMELADAMIIFPGGLGTMEELFDSLVWKRLEKKQTPIIIYNVDHFYDVLHSLLKTMVSEAFMPQKELDQIHFVSSLAEIETILNH